MHASEAQWMYPATRTVDSSDTYFGVTYKDPYRWMEYIKEPEVETWFKKQADYTNSLLNKLNGRDELIAEWKKLDKLQPPQISSRSFKNGRLFYRKRMPEETIGKLYYREGYNGKEQLLFDPSTYVKGKTLTLQAATPSYDGKKIVIAYSELGAEVSTLRIMDVDTKRFLKDSIYPADGGANWTFDNKSIYYGWIRSADNKDPTARLNPKMKLHVVGGDTKNDIDFFSNESYPEMKIEPSVYPFVFMNEDSRNYIFAGEGSVQSEMKLHYAPISEASSGKIRWKALSVHDDKLVRGIEIMDDDVFAITHNNAKNYKLVSTSLKNPDWKNATTIIPERPNQTIEYITHSKDYLFVVHSDGINNTLSKYDLKTKSLTEIKLPYKGTVNIFCLDNKTNNCYVGITSWVEPYTEFMFNAETNAFSASNLNKAPVYPAAYKDLVVEEVEVKGHDGTMIPLTIVYKKGLKKDGTNCTFMNSYGAYGYSMTPYFDVMANALAVKGVVLAFPHVRGGGEKGEAWYRSGFKTTKPNTWKDFISCAEYLIDKKYTNPAKLSGTGTSAGGVLISRAITERPELFAAAICNVGCANSMRLEFSSNGPVNIPEFGTVTDSVECKALYEMDGMHHVVKGTKYPAVISVAGWNDPRVVPWQPGKFAAAVQHASSSGKPVLIKVNYDNGHFTEDRNVTYSNFADQFAFVLWQTGHPDFQEKKQ